MLLRNLALITLVAGLGTIATTPLAIAQLQRFNPTFRSTDPITSPVGLGRHGWGRMGHGMMNSMSMNSEFEFLSQMIPHHQEAIDTAQMVLERSDRPEMQEFAQAIIRVQTAEIAQMQDWLEEWYPEQETTLNYTPMMRDLSTLEGDTLDQAFLEDMIMHHHMAVMMSHMLVNHGLVEHEAIQPFADQIARTQMAEIHQMQGWLQDWFNVADSTGYGMGKYRGERYRGERHYGERHGMGHWR
ncbi:MAG: hypothetical protein Kow00121_04940 [Elainellaceae cyanobacterium]